MRVVIIGNGIAGCTLATSLATAGDYDITLISDESPLPFARTSLMYIFMGQVHMDDTLLVPKEAWKTNGIRRIHSQVAHLDPAVKSIILKEGEKIYYDTLVLATGSVVHRPAWWKGNLAGVTGLYHLQDLEKIDRWTRHLSGHACIAGGGLIGMELAEMLHSRGIATTLVAREATYMNHIFPHEEASMITRHICSQGVELLMEDEIEELIHDNGALQYVRLRRHGVRVCSFLGVTTGVVPNTGLAKEAGILTRHGIVVNETLETSLSSVFAIGDCAELQTPMPGRKATEAVWYTAKQMGVQLAEILKKQRHSYQPGVWFNSASFFKLRMQTYGAIVPHEVTGIQSIFWCNPGQTMSIRLQYNAHSNVLTGILCLGVRVRHAICERWLKRHSTIHEVVASWVLAGFEPEFSGDHHRIFQAYAQSALPLKQHTTL